MGLSPEEKKRIYEEEKARIEAEEAAKGNSTTKLPPNKAGLLCYVGFWVTGIIFLIIERKNKLVRFHAMQSLVVFGILNIIWGIPWAIANSIERGPWPIWGSYSSLAQLAINATYIGAMVVWGIFFAIWWIFWGILMYRTYHDNLYKVPLFGLGDRAEKLIAKLDSSK